MLEVEVAGLLHRRLGYHRLLDEEVPQVVHLDPEGRLHSDPVSDDPAKVLRFRLVHTDMHGATYSLLLHHRDFQFTAAHDDGAIALGENGELSPEDRVLLEKLLHHLQTASRRTLVSHPGTASSLWRRLRRRVGAAVQPE